MKNRLENLTRKMEEAVKTAEKDIREECYQKMWKDYTATHPRLSEKPEQRTLLEQMLKLYIHIEYDLWPKVKQLFAGDIIKYKQLAGIMLKMMQQWDREMAKLGFTYTAQAYIPAEERKSYDPKSVNRLQERVLELTKEVKESIDEATALAPLPTLLIKKKKPEDQKGE